MKYEFVVIGAGLGGLVTSALLAKAGRGVLLLEQHRIPGGYCTSYRRKGFVFDIPSVLNEVGDPGSFPDLAKLGLYDAVEFRRLDRFARLIFPDREIRLPGNDLEGCRDAFREAFPKEAGAVDAVFNRLVKLSRRMGSLGSGRRSILGSLSMALAVLDLVRLSRTSFHAYCRRYTEDERLISALGSFWAYGGLPPKATPAASYLALAASTLGRPVHFPIGGYQVIPDFLAKRLQSDGGEIRYRTAVDRIVVEHGRACGVITGDGERIDCDVVVSNADTRRTLTTLLGGGERGRKVDHRLAKHRPSPSGIAIQLGTDLDLSEHDVDYGQVFINETWDGDRFFEQARQGRLDVPSSTIQYGIQAPSLLSGGLAPEGKHVLHMRLFPADSEGWSSLRSQGHKGPSEYRERKEELAEGLIEKAETVVPGLASSVEVMDVCTPPTFERYTSATGGGWYDTVGATGGPAAKTPIRNLYFTGTKARGCGGLPVAVAGGLEIARALLRS